MADDNNILGASLAASGLGAIGSVGSAILSSISGRDRQQEMLEYNSPVNQVRRLRQAGINPAFALSNGALDSGNASSAAPPMPQFDVNSLAQGVRDGMQLRIQKDLTDSEIRQNDANSYAQEMSNKFALQENLLKLYQLRSQADKDSKEAKLLDEEINLRKKDLESYDRRIGASVGKQEAEARYIDAQAKYQTILNQFAPQQQEALIKQINAHTNELNAAAEEHNASAARQIAEKAVAEARKEGLDIANDQADAMVDALVDKAFSEADKAYYEAGASSKFYYGGEVGKRLPLSGYTDNGSYNRRVKPSSRGVPVVSRKRSGR